MIRKLAAALRNHIRDIQLIQLRIQILIVMADHKLRIQIHDVFHVRLCGAVKNNEIIDLRMDQLCPVGHAAL